MAGKVSKRLTEAIFRVLPTFLAARLGGKAKTGVFTINSGALIPGANMLR